MKNTKEMTIGFVSVAAASVGANAAMAQDWSGPYAGAAVGFASGVMPMYQYDDSDYVMNGFVSTAFAGYNWQLQNGVVLGTELAVQLNSVNGDGDEESSYDEDYNVNSMIDLKVKAGKGFGNILAYGFAGVSSGTSTAYDGGEYQYINTGFNFGVGAEMMINDKMSVGIEHVMRSLYYPEGEDFHSSANTQLRIAYRF